MYEKKQKLSSEERMFLLEKYALICQKFMLYGKSEKLFEELNEYTPDNHPAKSNRVFNWAMLLYVKRNYYKATELLEKARKMYQQSNNRLGQAKCILNLGKIDLKLGDLDAAALKFRSVLSISEGYWQAYH